MNKPEPNPATRGLRSDSKSPALNQSQSASPVNSSTQSRYAAFDFTEDPFKNYRYEDLANIDPFEEETLDKNKNVSSGKDFFKFEDDLAYETPIGSEREAFESKFPKADVFETDFTFGSDLMAATAKAADKVNGNAINLFSNSEHGFSEKNSSGAISDPFFTKKDDKKMNQNLKEDDFFGRDKLDKVEGMSLPKEELQLAWAAKESLRLEEERLKQEAQEKADYEYALALSKKDSTKDKKTIRDFLRLGRNTPAA